MTLYRSAFTLRANKTKWLSIFSHQWIFLMVRENNSKGPSFLYVVWVQRNQTHFLSRNNEQSERKMICFFYYIPEVCYWVSLRQSVGYSYCFIKVVKTRFASTGIYCPEKITHNNCRNICISQFVVRLYQNTWEELALFNDNFITNLSQSSTAKLASSVCYLKQLQALMLSYLIG